MNALNIVQIVFMVIFGIIVVLTIHEFGHFVFAKLFRVNVKEFSIGFGPVLFKTFTKRANMQISLRLLPFGAYVLMDSASIRKAYLDDPNAKKYNFYLRARPHKTKLLEQVNYWKQMIIMFGGILFNFLAFAIFLGVVKAVQPNVFLQISLFVKNLFVSIGQSFVLYSLWPREAVAGAGNDIPPSVFTQRPDAFLLLSSLLSINLATGIVNFIPIAPLDGWKIMQLTYEKISRKPLPEKLLVVLSIIGLIVVFWITIGSIINQIVR
ncbi:site-2 protease family protein [[Mycoplasma] testudinis]|uniref:site-2 protease family protein n=1 Tax=[Mycoplasma] testudinis TaxID=33924 RepID=UPI000696CEDC|nr:site-2 protease family protein [[Mycoplasma] testudinis]